MFDVVQDALELALRRNRAEPRLRIERIAGDHLLRAFGDLADELVLDRLVDEQPRSGGADFALAVENADGRAAHGRVQIGIGKHDVRRLAAELERDVLQRVGGGPHDALARGRVARKRDLVDAGMLDDGLADGGCRFR